MLEQLTDAVLQRLQLGQNICFTQKKLKKEAAPSRGNCNTDWIFLNCNEIVFKPTLTLVQWSIQLGLRRLRVRLDEDSTMSFVRVPLFLCSSLYSNLASSLPGCSRWSNWVESHTSEVLEEFDQSTEAPWFCGNGKIKSCISGHSTKYCLPKRLAYYNLNERLQILKFIYHIATSSDFKYCRSSWSSQPAVSVGSPVQWCPPFWGEGLEQERLRELRPPEHKDQGDQQDQLPWITPSFKGCKRKIKAFILFHFRSNCKLVN